MILRGNVYSETLSMDTGLTIVTPKAYQQEGNYKTIYLLHGLFGNQDTWVNRSLLPIYAENYNAIFILPEANRSFYTDMAYGFDYFTYITDELPKICKSFFNISSKREDTAIMGGSMGGYGALKCALTKPEQYGYCCAFASACLFLKEKLNKYRQIRDSDTHYDQRFLKDLESAFGENLEWQPSHDILTLAKKTENNPLKPIIYAVCGTEDKFYEENNHFCAEMKKLDFEFTYEQWTGTHDWTFFNEGLKKSLEKINFI